MLEVIWQPLLVVLFLPGVVCYAAVAFMDPCMHPAGAGKSNQSLRHSGNSKIARHSQDSMIVQKWEEEREMEPIHVSNKTWNLIHNSSLPFFNFISLRGRYYR